ncbi:DUF6193 family natural product biosynthesis protein [Streptomyces sp. KL116D]|uniref:DUF6193 family natural product biosynthesis protein n=1 Tax=Streptomyces sp. KL116D TaxID=3045152 RepID=UPI003557E918
MTTRRVHTELLEAAYAEPRLRQLFPWTGMGGASFQPLHREGVDLGHPLHRARHRRHLLGPSGRCDPSGVGQVATVQEAIALVVDRLPPDLRSCLRGHP